MKIDQKIVQHVALLGRLRLTPEEEKLYREQLTKILDYIEMLKEVNTQDVLPTYQVLPLKNIFREDESRKSPGSDQIIANAPDQENKAFRVPRFVESE